MVIQRVEIPALSLAETGDLMPEWKKEREGLSLQIIFFDIFYTSKIAKISFFYAGPILTQFVCQLHNGTVRSMTNELSTGGFSLCLMGVDAT